jgi:Tape measure protein
MSQNQNRTIKLIILPEDDKALASAKRLQAEYSKIGYNSVKRIDYDSSDFKAKTANFKQEIEAIKAKSASFKQEAEGIKAKATELTQANAQTSASISTLGIALGTFSGQIAVEAFTQVISFAGKAAIAIFNYSSALEDNQQKFSQILGNTGQAVNQLAELRKFSVATGQDFDWVSNTAKEFDRLQLSTSELLPLLTAIGNVNAGIGGDENSRKAITGVLEDVVKTRKFGLEAINQLESAGFSQSKTFELLRNQTGKTNEELVAMAKNGKISSSVFISAFERFAENKFGNAMEKQSATFTGAVKSISNSSAEAANKSFQPWYDQFSKFSQYIADFTKSEGGQNALRFAISRTFSPVLGGGTQQFREVGIGAGLNGAVNGLGTNTENDKQVRYEDLEIEREKQKTALSNFYQQRFDIISTNLKVEEALNNQSLRLTLLDEENGLKRSANLKDASFAQQIASQIEFYKKQISLANGDAKEITRLNYEADKVIRGLNADRTVNILTTNRAIAEAERRQLESSRTLLIAFRQLQSRELSQAFGSKQFDISRLIGKGVDVQSNFNELKNLTTKNYQDLSTIALQTYQTQIQNERLTNAEKVNLTKSLNLDLKGLAESNRRELLQISDQQYQEQVSLLNRQTQQIQTAFQSQISIYNGLESFVNPDNFSVRSQEALYEGVFAHLDKLNAKRQELEDRINLAAGIGAIQIAPATDDFPALFKIPDEVSAEVSKLQTELFGLNDQYNELKDGISGTTTEFVLFVAGIQDSTDKINFFDKASEKSLLLRQTLERESLDSRLESAKSLLELARINKDEKAQLELGGQKDKNGVNGKGGLIGELTSQENILALKQSSESLELYKKSLTGLKETIASFRNGDKATIAGAEYQAESSFYKNQIGQFKEIVSLKYQLANSPLIDTNKIELSQLQQLNELRNRETDAIIRKNSALFALSTKGIFNQQEADALILDHINQSTKSLTEIYAGAKIGVIDTFWGALETKIGKATAKLGIFGDVTKELLTNLLKLATSRLFAPQSGQQSAGGGGSFFGSLLGGIFNGGNRSGATTGSGGSGGNFGTPSFNPSFGTGGNFAGVGSNGGNQGSFGGINPIALLTGGGNISPVGGFRNPGGLTDKQLFDATNIRIGGGGIASRLGGFFGKGGAGGGLSALAPLLGGQLGGKIGGGLGAVAGGALGLSAFALLNPALLASALPFGAASGALIGLLANPFTIGIAGAALVAAVLIKRNKQRRKDETTRNTSMLDTLKGLNEIMTGLNANPPRGVDNAISSSKEISANYYTMANGLKGKTKTIALKDGRERVDPLVTAIALQVPIAKATAANIDSRRNRLVAEFAGGNYFESANYGNFKRRNGMLAGTYTGRDYLPSLLGDGEMVLNEYQIDRVKNVSGFDPFKYAKIPNYADGISVSPASQGSSGSLGSQGSNTTQINFTPTINISIEGGEVKSVDIQTPEGQRVLTNVLVNLAKNKELKKIGISAK